jgi:hypothetical protein
VLLIVSLPVCNISNSKMNNSFGKPIIPDNETERIKALRYYATANNLPVRFFHNLAHIVAQTFNTPIALISLVDQETVVLKAIRVWRIPWKSPAEPAFVHLLC